VYWPPGAVSRVFCDQLADVFDQLLLCGRRFVVCGDFNNCSGAGDNQLDTSLVDMLKRYNLCSTFMVPRTTAAIRWTFC